MLLIKQFRFSKRQHEGRFLRFHS